MLSVKKCYQRQLFKYRISKKTISNGYGLQGYIGKGKILASTTLYCNQELNNVNEWYSCNRRGYRK